MSVKMVVSLGGVAVKALESDEAFGQQDASVSVARAIRCYLNDIKSGAPGWSYPAFLRRGGSEGQVELDLSIDDALWRSLEKEAERQKVSTPQMLEHAVLYFAAEVDAGRITERILAELDEESPSRG
jgi:hypothetical protein